MKFFALRLRPLFIRRSPRISCSDKTERVPSVKPFSIGRIIARISPGLLSRAACELTLGTISSWSSKTLASLSREPSVQHPSQMRCPEVRNSLRCSVTTSNTFTPSVRRSAEKFRAGRPPKCNAPSSGLSKGVCLRIRWTARFSIHEASSRYSRSIGSGRYNPAVLDGSPDPVSRASACSLRDV